MVDDDTMTRARKAYARQDSDGAATPFAAVEPDGMISGVSIRSVGMAITR